MDDSDLLDSIGDIGSLDMNSRPQTSDAPTKLSTAPSIPPISVEPAAGDDLDVTMTTVEPVEPMSARLDADVRFANEIKVTQYTKGDASDDDLEILEGSDDDDYVGPPTTDDISTQLNTRLNTLVGAEGRSIDEDAPTPAKTVLPDAVDSDGEAVLESDSEAEVELGESSGLEVDEDESEMSLSESADLDAFTEIDPIAPAVAPIPTTPAPDADAAPNEAPVAATDDEDAVVAGTDSIDTLSESSDLSESAALSDSAALSESAVLSESSVLSESADMAAETSEEFESAVEEDENEEELAKAAATEAAAEAAEAERVKATEAAAAAEAETAAAAAEVEALRAKEAAEAEAAALAEAEAMKAKAEAEAEADAERQREEAAAAEAARLAEQEAAEAARFKAEEEAAAAAAAEAARLKAEEEAAAAAAAAAEAEAVRVREEAEAAAAAEAARLQEEAEAEAAAKAKSEEAAEAAAAAASAAEQEREQEQERERAAQLQRDQEEQERKQAEEAEAKAKAEAEAEAEAKAIAEAVTEAESEKLEILSEKPEAAASDSSPAQAPAAPTPTASAPLDASMDASVSLSADADSRPGSRATPRTSSTRPVIPPVLPLGSAPAAAASTTLRTSSSSSSRTSASSRPPRPPVVSPPRAPVASPSPVPAPASASTAASSASMSTSLSRTASSRQPQPLSQSSSNLPNSPIQKKLTASARKPIKVTPRAPTQAYVDGLVAKVGKLQDEVCALEDRLKAADDLRHSRGKAEGKVRHELQQALERERLSVLEKDGLRETIVQLRREVQQQQSMRVQDRQERLRDGENRDRAVADVKDHERRVAARCSELEAALAEANRERESLAASVKSLNASCEASMRREENLILSLRGLEGRVEEREQAVSELRLDAGTLREKQQRDADEKVKLTVEARTLRAKAREKERRTMVLEKDMWSIKTVLKHCVVATWVRERRLSTILRAMSGKVREAALAAVSSVSGDGELGGASRRRAVEGVTEQGLKACVAAVVQSVSASVTALQRSLDATAKERDEWRGVAKAVSSGNAEVVAKWWVLEQESSAERALQQQRDAEMVRAREEEKLKQRMAALGQAAGQHKQQALSARWSALTLWRRARVEHVQRLFEHTVSLKRRAAQLQAAVDQSQQQHADAMAGQPGGPAAGPVPAGAGKAGGPKAGVGAGDGGQRHDLGHSDMSVVVEEAPLPPEAWVSESESAAATDCRKPGASTGSLPPLASHPPKGSNKSRTQPAEHGKRPFNWQRLYGVSSAAPPQLPPAVIAKLEKNKTSGDAGKPQLPPTMALR